MWRFSRLGRSKTLPQWLQGSMVLLLLRIVDGDIILFINASIPWGLLGLMGKYFGYGEGNRWGWRGKREGVRSWREETWGGDWGLIRGDRWRRRCKYRGWGDVGRTWDRGGGEESCWTGRQRAGQVQRTLVENWFYVPGWADTGFLEKAVELILLTSWIVFASRAGWQEGVRADEQRLYWCSLKVCNLYLLVYFRHEKSNQFCARLYTFHHLKVRVVQKEQV